MERRMVSPLQLPFHHHRPFLFLCSFAYFLLLLPFLFPFLLIQFRSLGICVYSPRSLSTPAAQSAIRKKNMMITGCFYKFQEFVSVSCVSCIGKAGHDAQLVRTGSNSSTLSAASEAWARAHGNRRRRETSFIVDVGSNTISRKMRHSYGATLGNHTGRSARYCMLLVAIYDVPACPIMRSIATYIKNPRHSHVSP
jgi:hypothetical protein